MTRVNPALRAALERKETKETLDLLDNLARSESRGLRAVPARMDHRAREDSRAWMVRLDKWDSLDLSELPD